MVAAISQRRNPMKGIFGMAAAVALVILQLGAIAVYSVETPVDLTPNDGSELVTEPRA